jgi:hypothetical protein
VVVVLTVGALAVGGSEGRSGVGGLVEVVLRVGALAVGGSEGRRAGKGLTQWFMKGVRCNTGLRERGTGL